jgi:hypothetical protein
MHLPFCVISQVHSNTHQNSSMLVQRIMMGPYDVHAYWEHDA